MANMTGTPGIFSKSGFGWGVLDTLDHAWIGDDRGPYVYVSRELARAAATLAGVRLTGKTDPVSLGRLQAKLYRGGPVRRLDPATPRAQADRLEAPKGGQPAPAAL